jgi:PAS domain S-box-containing protein
VKPVMKPVAAQEKTPPGSPDFLLGGGEMSRVVAAKDWSLTPLGAIEHWPQSLRTTVSLCLASNFPISLAWGPECTQIYNDGYWPICGAKHPHSMGQDFRECWASAWPAIGEAFESAWKGKARFLENQRMFLDRNGYLEETFFTFSFSPVRDESGEVGGLFHPVTETTAKMLGERRIKTLRDMAESAAKAVGVEDCCRKVSAVLSECPFDLPFVLLYLLDEEGDSLRLASSVGIIPGSPANPERIERADFGKVWPLLSVLNDGKSKIVEDFTERLGLTTCGPYPEAPKRAIVMPIPRLGSTRWAGVVVAGVSARLPLDTSYRGFYDLIAGQLATTISNVRAYEEERRRAEALAEVDRAKTVFFANISHEFRTPLTLMLGPLQEMLARPGQSVRVNRDEVSLINRNGLRLLRLVNALLEFSRIEAGRVQAKFEAVDLPAITAELAGLFRAAIETAGLRLVVDCAPLGQPVYVDRVMWEKVVLNLLSNAFKFTFEGEIRIALREHATGVELLVADTGTGIPSEALPRLFDRFYQVENAQGRTFEGTGIGLSLVQELAKLHGGKVQVESKMGLGSAFTVSLPFGHAHLAAKHVKMPLSSTATALHAEAYVEEALRWLPGRAEENIEIWDAQQETLQTKRGRILLADDNADMRRYVHRVLEHDFEVEAVANGEEALKAALARLPDLVLTDVMMPKLDGFGLLAALRSDKRTRAVPVVLLSARAGEEARVKGLQAGADDYLTKPFGARELLARVRTNVELSKLRSEVLRQEESRRTADQIERQWRNFDALLANTPDHVWQVDRQGRFIYANRSMLSLWRKDADEVIGTNIYGFNPPREMARDFEEQLQRVVEARKPVRHEAQFTDPGGKMVCYEYVLTPILASNRSVEWVAGISRDITERKTAENALKSSLDEKTALLREVHHRVKNNLQIISSLLAMQASKLKDQSSVAHLLDSERRVMSMALVHEQLYSHDDMASIDLAAYARNLVLHLFSSLNHNELIEIHFDLAPTMLTIDQAIPCGLILNESVTNALKYAYPHGENGEIAVKLSCDAESVMMAVSDQGVGFPRDLDTTQTLGLQLIQLLTEQLSGEAEFSRSLPGTSVTIRFPRAE